MSSVETFAFHIEESEAGLRLDKLLSQKMSGFSRTALQNLIVKGLVSVDGEPLLDSSYKVKPSQNIQVSVPPPIEATPLPQAIPLDILFEDKELIVINKPAGMVVHPGAGNPDKTLVNALLSHCGDSLSGINGVKRPGIVHRLDKDTSGVLVAAKTDRAHQRLAHQLSSREMKRVYWAVVWGMVLPKEGVIEGAIGRDPRHRQRMSIRSNGKFARTHYKVLRYFGKVASLVECRLETGRTHQIRVHLASKGYSLIGDKLYGKPPRAIPPIAKVFLDKDWFPGRQALHAKTLSFIHPQTEESLEFSTELPEDMRSLLDMLDSLEKQN